MAQVRAAEAGDLAHDGVRLFAAIGDFLQAHRLSPDPDHYLFAYQMLTAPDGVVARRVAELTDSGVRLTARGIADLGGRATARPVPRLALVPPQSPNVTDSAAEQLVARTQVQVDGFGTMVAAMRAETQGFGRDLAASAAAMPTGQTGGSDVVRLTEEMIDRVRSSEARLSAAEAEAGHLREALAAAQGDARRDPLTDLPNRRAVEEAFAHGTATCFAICDIDRFKRVNDDFGHSIGDRVLKAIATTLARVCEGHLVARWGGEEFVVLFTGAPPAAALRTIEAARGEVAERRFRLRETDRPLGAITLSAGLVAVSPGAALADVAAAADVLLYRAKESGRDRVVSA